MPEEEAGAVDSCRWVEYPLGQPGPYSVHNQIWGTSLTSGQAFTRQGHELDNPIDFSE